MNDSIGEHTDWGLFTLLQANAPGLEVDIDGDWVAVDGVPVADPTSCGMPGPFAVLHGLVNHVRAPRYALRNEVIGAAVADVHEVHGAEYSRDM